LFRSYINEVNFIVPNSITTVDITKPELFVGGLIGSCVVFIFSSWAIDGVGIAA